MKKMLSAAALAIVLMLSMISPAYAAAARTPYESELLRFTSGGVNYEAWTTLYEDGANQFRGTTWLCNTAYKDLPAGYLGVSNFLCRPNGSMYLVEDMTYTSYSTYFTFIGKRTVRADSNGIYSGGVVATYNGTRYEYRSAPNTVIRYPTVKSAAVEVEAVDLSKLAVRLDKNGQYPVTASGKTYGSALAASSVGCSPDLILAEGTDGKTGYVKIEDLRPDVNSPEEALSYMAEQRKNEDGSYTIPLYDLKDHVIGDFQVLVPNADEEIPEEVRETIKGFWPRNSKGETLGTIAQASGYGIDLDLIAASGTEGQIGYIRQSDTVWGKWKNSIKTPEDALKYMEEVRSHPSDELIPLYDSEGNVIGQYLHVNWSEKIVPDGGIAAAKEMMEMNTR